MQISLQKALKSVLKKKKSSSSEFRLNLCDNLQLYGVDYTEAIVDQAVVLFENNASEEEILQIFYAHSRQGSKSSCLSNIRSQDKFLGREYV